MTSLFRHRLALILAAAFVLRLVVLLCFQPWDPRVELQSVIVADAPTYHRLALCILQQGSFCNETFRTPGYPLFVAGVYALFGIKPWAVLLVQAALDLVNMVMVFLIGRLLINERVGVIAAGLLAVDTAQVVSASSLLSDGMFVSFLLGGLYLVLRGLKEQRLRCFVYGGLVLGLSTLTRPITQPYLMLLVLLMLLWPAATLKARVAFAACLVASYVVALSPWLYRNHEAYGHAAVSTAQGENLLFWQVAYGYAWETHQDPPTVSRQFEEKARAGGWDPEHGNPFDNEAIARSMAVHTMAADPVLYAKRWLIGIMHTYQNLDRSRIARRLGVLPPEAAANGAVEGDTESVSGSLHNKSTAEAVIGGLVLCLLAVEYGAFVLGIPVLLRRRDWWVAGLLLLSVAYFSFTSGIIGQARFRLPIAPFYLLVGAMFIDSLLARSSQRYARGSKVPQAS